MRTFVVSVGVVFVSLCVIGCSGAPDDRPAVVPVTGKITYKGKPVSGALVNFSSEKSPRSANGMTDSDGRFSLTTFNTDDGAIPGEYQVSVTKSVSQGDSSVPASATAPDLSKGLLAGYSIAVSDKTGKIKPPSGGENQLPAKYADGTKLKATVMPTGKNDITYDLVD